MFVNLWSDLVTIHTDDDVYILPFVDIEKSLASHITRQCKKNPTWHIYSLIWPWSFTNLRVGCLTMSTLSHLSQGQISFFVTNKIALYTSLYQTGILTREMVIYIGQRKNFWLYDLETQTYTVIAYSTLDDIYRQWLACIDYVTDAYPDFASHPGMISYIYRDDRIYIAYQGRQIDITSHFSIHTDPQGIQPYYGVEYTVG
jgi:hypothetical protein